MSKNKKIGDFEFSEHLRSVLKGYNGAEKDVLRYSPEIFMLCTDLVSSLSIGKKEKNMLYKTIAYFILPHDIYSESVYGVKGLKDDLMLCLYVLNVIAKRHGYDILIDRWNGNPNILKNLLDKEFHRMCKENKKLFEEVLKEVDIDLV